MTVAAILAGLLGTGCGLLGEEERVSTPRGLDLSGVGSDETEPAPSPEDPVAARWVFVDEVNRRCDEALGQFVRNMQVPTDEAGMLAFAEDGMRRSQALIDELRGFTPPPGEEAVYAAILDQQDALLARLRAIFAEPDLVAAVEVHGAEVEAMEQAADAALVDYGLTSCTGG